MLFKIRLSKSQFRILNIKAYIAENGNSKYLRKRSITGRYELLGKSTIRSISRGIAMKSYAAEKY